MSDNTVSNIDKQICPCCNGIIPTPTRQKTPQEIQLENNKLENKIRDMERYDHYDGGKRKRKTTRKNKNTTKRRKSNKRK